MQVCENRNCEYFSLEEILGNNLSDKGVREAREERLGNRTRGQGWASGGTSEGRIRGKALL